MHSIDPVRLQRLVDGELGLDEIQRLLRAAETQPDLWREMATTFVENRLWQNSFVELNGSVDSSFGKTETASPVEAHPVDSAVDPGTFDRNSPGWWLALAACVILALSIGFTAGQWGRDAGSMSPDVALQIPDAPAVADETPRLNQIVYRPDYQMQIEDTNGNQLMDSNIPLYDIRRAEQLGLTLKPRVIPDEVLQQIRNSGYQMKQNVQYVSGRMNDGRRFVVPLRQFEFVPGQ